MTRLLSFRLSSQLCAVDVNDVLEILPPKTLRSVPKAPSALLGLLSYRGAPIPAIDPKSTLGLSAVEPTAESATLVLKTSDGPLALVADSILDVREVANSRLAPPPLTMPKLARKLIQFVIPEEKELMFVLRPEQVANVN
ncbi:MAG: hypothetical protein B6A08_06200 [Sorangiineae bacterium NIC37A_2]|jgi:purine-binding chemotaxis protein CheW|nr:MAG: hypothetical protein B6A08_06200 [Sorangiineae bacterium NIC37A_2]